MPFSLRPSASPRARREDTEMSTRLIKPKAAHYIGSETDTSLKMKKSVPTNWDTEDIAMQSVPAAMKNNFPLNIINDIRAMDPCEVLWVYILL